MPVVVLPALPPWSGVAGAELAAETPLSPSEAADLYAAALADAAVAVERSGADLLVNYRAAADLPDGGVGSDGDPEGEGPADRPAGEPADDDAEAAVRATVAAAVEEPGAVRYEVQVGSSRSARVGNTVTHLLEEEGATSVGVLRPTTPMVRRATLDSAAMKSRSAPVVLGPTTDGRVYYAGFTEPIDFADAFAAPAVETLTDRAGAADLDVDFLDHQPIVETGRDLASLLPVLRSRVAAERVVPEHTATVLYDLGIDVVAGEGGLRVVR